MRLANLLGCQGTKEEEACIQWTDQGTRRHAHSKEGKELERHAFNLRIHLLNRLMALHICTSYPINITGAHDVLVELTPWMLQSNLLLAIKKWKWSERPWRCQSYWLLIRCWIQSVMHIAKHCYLVIYLSSVCNESRCFSKHARHPTLRLCINVCHKKQWPWPNET